MPECLKDLQRFLRHDDPATRDAFFVLGKAQTTRLHLIPLITRYAEDADIVYNACERPSATLHAVSRRTASEQSSAGHYPSRCVLHAVKVVTFLTMPVERESQSYCAQVPGAPSCHAHPGVRLYAAALWHTCPCGAVPMSSATSYESTRAARHTLIHADRRHAGR